MSRMLIREEGHAEATAASADVTDLRDYGRPAPQDVAPTAQDSLREMVAWGYDQARKRSHDAHRYLLVLRFALLNLVGFALLGVAYVHGLVHNVVNADPTYLSVLIFLVFLGGLVICARKVWQTSSELNSLRARDAARAPRHRR